MRWVTTAPMKRRDVLLSPVLLGFVRSARASEQPWSARLLRGGFDGTQWWSGLSITLRQGWKTYWRVPGDGGIAPAFELTGNNVASTQVSYPAPHRFVAASSTTIGYKDAVVFPIAVTPQDIAKSVTVTLKAFFGVCEEVCIPAPFESQVTFLPATSSAPDQRLIADWQAKVPSLGDMGPITKVSAGTHKGQLALVVNTRVTVSDLFVEGNPLHYFEAPVIMEHTCLVPVKGAKSADELRATPVRITLLSGSIALEQMMTVV
jgi:DsbC/DsbD-like thiol-disulfide interchange protein